MFTIIDYIGSVIFPPVDVVAWTSNHDSVWQKYNNFDAHVRNSWKFDLCS
jgi:hypothetical protein